MCSHHLFLSFTLKSFFFFYSFSSTSCCCFSSRCEEAVFVCSRVRGLEVFQEFHSTGLQTSTALFGWRGEKELAERTRTITQAGFLNFFLASSLHLHHTAVRRGKCTFLPDFSTFPKLMKSC